MRRSPTLLLSTETEEREGRLIPVPSSLKTAHITRVHSKRTGDKLDSKSHLSISHSTGLFTCYINHLRTRGEGRLSRHLWPVFRYEQLWWGQKNTCEENLHCASERGFQCKESNESGLSHSQTHLLLPREHYSLFVPSSSGVA